MQGFTLTSKSFCIGSVRVPSQVQDPLCPRKGGRLQNTVREGFCWIQSKLLVWLSALLLNSVIQLSGGLPPASHSLFFKGRGYIMHLHLLGIRPDACHIFKAEEGWVSGLIHLYRNGFLSPLLVEPRAKQPSQIPGPIHATNYPDTWSQILSYLGLLLLEQSLKL